MSVEDSDRSQFETREPSHPAGETALRAFYQDVPIPTYAWRRVGDDFVLVGTNRAAETITGGAISKLLGRRASDLYRDEPDILEEFARCYQSRGVIRREMRYLLRSTGEERDLDVTYVFLPPDTVLVHTQDITERKRTEQALWESEERFRRLVGVTFEGYAVHDDGTILDANELTAMMYGYSLPELIGMRVEELAAPESRAEVVHRYRSGDERTYRVHGRRKDSSVFPVEIRGKPVTYENRIVRIVALRDLTDRGYLGGAPHAGSGGQYGLTSRELSVLYLIAQGKSDKQIADVLGIRPLTVSKHVTNILSKMDASSRTEAGVRAVREGIVS